MRIFIVEDDKWRNASFKKRFIQHELIIIDNAPEAISFLEKDRDFDIFCLDHDLGHRAWVDSNDANTGYQVAKYLINCQEELKDKLFLVHSLNAPGAENIISLLKSNGFNDVRYYPGLWLLHEYYNFYYKSIKL